ncbi:hypothetical protein R7W29_001113 [Citrobacter freundii]|nr:hypothetical protein [Citrobacter freundii]
MYTVNQSATCLWLFFAQIEVASQSYPDHRILFLVDCMGTAAAALIGGKQGVPPHPYNERVKRGGETSATVVRYGLPGQCAVVRDSGGADNAISGEYMRVS